MLKKPTELSCSLSYPFDDDENFLPSTKILSSSNSEMSEIALESIENTTTISYPQSSWKILKLAGPYSLTLIIRMGAHMAGVIMISQLGVEELAASSLFVQFIALSSTAGLGFTAATGLLTAKIYKGSDNNNNIGLVYQRGILCAAILAVPFATAAFFSSSILQFLGQQLNLSELSQIFLRAFIPTIFANYILMNFDQLMMSVNKPHYVLINMILERSLFAFLAAIPEL